jgi:CHASE2 domain-containing sensor protein
VTREYERRVRLVAEGNRTVPSFTEVIESVDETHSQQPCRVDPRASDGPEREVLPFPGRVAPPRRFLASAVLAGLNQPAWRKEALMNGKIVLLGGAYEASRDYYATPFKERVYGVDIQASILAADVAHEQIKILAWSAFFSIDAALGFFLILAGWFVSRHWLLAVTGGTVIFVLAGSIFLFQAFQVYLSFVPMLISVGMHHSLHKHSAAAARPATSPSRARRGRRA